MPRFTPFSLPLRSYLLPFGLPALLLGLLSLFVLTPYFRLHQSDLASAITLDFVLTVPLLYLWLIRNKPISKLSVSPVLILCFLLASYLIPAHEQDLLIQLRTYALPVFELGILAWIFYQVHRTVITFKAQKGHKPDFFQALKSACREIFPARVSSIVATEAAVFYYGLNFRRSTPAENAFTYHRKNGTLMMHGAFIGLLVLETVGAHFLLALWSHTAAWILSILGAYTLLQVFGIVRSIPHRPIRLDQEALHLSYGILAETTVKLSQIDHIEASRKTFPIEGLDRKLSPVGDFESHNFILHLQSPAILEGLYGRKKEFTKLAFFVDDAPRFKAMLQQLGIQTK